MAAASGLKLRRDPGLAGASYVIPVVSLWWPYQAVRDLFQGDACPAALVRRWWAAHLLAGAALVGELVAAFVGRTAFVAMSLVAFVLTASASVLGRWVMEAVLEHHGQLVKRRS